MLQATQLLHWISEARSRNAAPEITLASDFDSTVETKAAVAGLRTPELRKGAPSAHPRYGNHQGALC
jgi:hypothetical protein